ncbi:MAG: RagB/SusD family nutrient uptake outer membrane protein, partial [Bacteroidales bacterium]|nr:RagB/SusD family nutrient uptake outer membrane protein [Bacteroidales bacterium]
AMEGHRWFDLVRTGRFVERMKEHAAYEASVAESNKVEIAQNLKDYMVLMPIPQREVDLNADLTQNPGY